MQNTKLITKILSKKNRKTEKQIQNLNEIGELAKKFHTNCGTLSNSVREKINLLLNGEDYIVIEVAHQPNFMPYYGVWKKAVFAHFLANSLDKRGHNAVALFGFVDQDTTMSPFLSRNKIPYNSKKNYKNIGFKIKGENEWWRLWCKQPLPPVKDVEKQIDFLITTYTNHGLLRDDDDLVQLENLLRECYISNCTFSEANAKFVSKICNQIYDLNVVFFIYSEVQESNIFTTEFEYLLSKRMEYVDIYNKTIEQKGIELEKVPEDHVPFWYHCECGGKVRLKVNGNEGNMMLKGMCPICKRDFEIEVGDDFDLSTIYKSISFEAVSRELIVPDALGTDVYVEGLGGSLSFRQISNVIAEKLKFNNPLTVKWNSHDKYISVLLHKSIYDFIQKYSINALQYRLQSIDVNDRVMCARIAELDIHQEALKKELKKHKPQSNEFLAILDQLKDVNIEKKKLNAEMVKFSSMSSDITKLSKACNITPSIVDEALSVGFDNILKYWLLNFKENDFDIEHIIQLPVKTIEGINYKSITDFINFIEDKR